ncbi:TnpV protein [uncultured Muribaculum sp.]|uniref:TnpV protein n=1 Tax=uncultured Muribaculum sp. TaxID=1918613 RepID=UPI000EA13E36|nr:TnpV protein [bacterium D16-54]RKJ08509.1 TnpV protein [bacterium D16-56]
MKELPERIHDDTNGLDYVLVGDYYIPALRLTEESRPIGHWGRRRKAYLEEARPALYCSLLLSGKLWTHLADVDEQAQERLDLIMEQMKAAEGVTEELKARNQLAWVQHMNSIRSRAEEIIYAELVYT